MAGDSSHISPLGAIGLRPGAFLNAFHLLSVCVCVRVQVCGWGGVSGASWDESASETCISDVFKLTETAAALTTSHLKRIMNFMTWNIGVITSSDTLWI